MQRRQLIMGAACGAASATLSIPAQSQPSFENGISPSTSTAKIICGFPQGGTADGLARQLAEKLRGILAADITVENRPGTAGQLAIESLIGSPADGRTLLLTPSSMLSIYPFTYPRLSYKATDVLPISSCAVFSHAFGVGPSVPSNVRTIKDFAEWIQLDETRASFSSPAAGSMPHLIGSCVFKLIGQEIRHKPVGGGPSGMQDLIKGKINAMCAPVGEFLPHLQVGKVRLLALSSTGRNKFAPNTPTFREQGIPITVREWYGLYLPVSSSSDLTRRVALAIQKALSSPDLGRYATAAGLEISPSMPEGAASTLQADAAEWRRLIKIIGFTAES